MRTTNLRGVIAELRLECEQIDCAIRSLELLASASEEQKEQPRKMPAKAGGGDSSRARKQRTKTVTAG